MARSHDEATLRFYAEFAPTCPGGGCDPGVQGPWIAIMVRKPA